MKAVILDLRGKHAAVLDETGRIVKIPNADYEIGQEIELHAVPSVRPKTNKRFAAAAAAAVLVLGLGTGTAFALPYGTVTLDSDSSIEYTINRFDQVLSVRALNEEGEEILSSLDEQSLRFRPVKEAIAAALEQQETDEERTVAITAETPNDRHTERLQEQLREHIPERRSPDRREGSPELPQNGMPEDEMPVNGLPQERHDGFVPGEESSQPDALPNDTGLGTSSQGMQPPEETEALPRGETPAELRPESFSDRPEQPPSRDDTPPDGFSPPAKTDGMPDSRPEVSGEVPAEVSELPGGMPPPEQQPFGSPDFDGFPPTE